MSGEQHVKASAALRGRGQFAEALAEIEDNLASFDDITIVPALLQALYAAKSAGDTTKAQEIARQLAQHDPDIPSIKEFLP
jgi:hypothetical protein